MNAVGCATFYSINPFNRIKDSGKDKDYLIFHKGMSVEEINAIYRDDPRVRRLKQNINSSVIWYMTYPNKPEGVAMIDFVIPQEHGLLKVILYKLIDTQPNGRNIKSAFNKLHKSLSKKYGEGHKHDFLSRNSIWNKPEDFIQSLKTGHRKLNWTQTDFFSLKEWRLEAISLQTKISQAGKGLLIVSYEFQGWSNYIQKNRDKIKVIPLEIEPTDK